MGMTNELTSDYVKDLALNSAQAEYREIQDGFEKAWSIGFLPRRSYGLQQQMLRAMDGHLAGTKRGVTLPGGDVVPISQHVVRWCVYLAHRTVNAEGKPLLGDPVRQGFAAWAKLSESDAVLWMNCVDALVDMDGLREAVDEAKNALSGGSDPKEAAASSPSDGSADG